MINIWDDKNWQPMLLKERNKPFDSKDYIYEIKFDGIRAIIFANKNSVAIKSRNNKDITYLFPELQSIKKIVTKNVIFDGEIIAFDNEKISFTKIQERIHLKNNTRINYASTNNPVNFIAFDILYENRDITNLSLIDRKFILSKYKDTDNFIKIKYIDEKGKKLFKNIQKLGLEGIVAKLKTGKYYINERTDNFIKIKNLKNDNFLIGGYEIKKNNILSLSLGEYINNKFYFVGKVTITKKSNLYNKILNLKKDKNYFCNFDKNICYVKPTIFCNIEYLERTDNNHLRHPIYKE